MTTVVNVYTAQKGVWSVTAKITAIVAACFLTVGGSLFALYNFWVLEKVKERHNAEYYYPGAELKRHSFGGKQGDEGMIEKAKRKAKESALQPGSVV